MKMIILVCFLILSGCNVVTASETTEFNHNMAIAVVSREEGSGTRGAFVELLGIERGGIDHTFIEADVKNGTSAVINTIAGNLYSIGYISLSSLNDTITGVSIDGVSAEAETVQDGTYPLYRTFYFAMGDLSEAASDFMNFVLSAEGQALVESGGYITVDENAPEFTGADVNGTVVITGSTSVFPIVELLSEIYREINPNVNVEVHSTGSGAGITAAIDGTADLGMSSRGLRETELDQVDAVPFAYDGIAIIINNNNPMTDMTAEQVRQIFEGEVFRWDAVVD